MTVEATTRNWQRRDRAVRLQTRYTFPPVLESGKGAYVVDTDGNRYLDFMSGQICVVAGHSHPRYIEAIREQAERLIQRGSAFTDTRQIELAEILQRMCPGDLNKSYFACTGSESNEAALRMAKLITGRAEVVSLVRGYYGLTAGSFSATGLGGPFREGYGPTLPGVAFLPAPYAYRCPFKGCDDGNACGLTCLEYGLDVIARTTSNRPAAVLVEVIQGAGGIIPLPKRWLHQVRALCNEWGALLIVDEAGTGFGRTGKMFGFEHYEGVQPDILTLSKSLGGGVPVSAVVVRDWVADALARRQYHQSSSHTGDPLMAAAAIANLQIIEEEGLVANAALMGDSLFRGLLDVQSRHEIVGDVRGKGLFVGVEIIGDRATRSPSDELATAITKSCLSQGLLVGHTPGWVSENVIRLLPPLTVSKGEVDDALRILDCAVMSAQEPRSGRC